MRKRFLLFLLILCLTMALSAGVIADLGNFAGSSDYGGGSSGSSWDSDGDGFGGAIDFIGGVILFIIIVIWIMVDEHKKKKNGGDANDRSGRQGDYSPMSDYHSLDPAFKESAFREKLSNLYVQMQNCWAAKDIRSLRPYFDDAYFTQMERQLEQHRRQGRTNYVDRIAVLSVTLDGFRQEAGKDHILATIKTRIVDYTLDDRSGKLISGHKDREKFMTYQWDLCRTTGYQSTETAGLDKTVCPSCGAPLDINASARCPYCGSVIRSADHDWVICFIKGVSQVTK